MFLNKVNVRIALTFTLFSTIVSIIIFTALSLLIMGFLRNEDYGQMRYQLDVLESKYEKGGLNLIISDIDISNMMYEGKPYFVRMQKGPSVFDMGPSVWKTDYNYSLLNGVEPGSITILKSEFHEFNLLVLTHIAKDGTIFQTGISNQYITQFARVLRKVFIILLIPLIITSMIFGLWYSKNTLKPVLDLTNTIKEIIETGKRKKEIKKYSGDDELSELVNLFSTLFDSNENLIRGMKETLDNVSHDLRTPLTRIRGISEVALTNPDPESHIEALSDTIEEIDSIIKILNALLDITASENGVLKLDIQRFNIKNLIEKSVDLYSFIAEDKAINLLLKFDFNQEYIYGDEIKIRQAIANILDNAVKYSGKGEVVEIVVYSIEDRLIIKIKDSGIGIGQDEIKNIWDRLYRSTRSRNEPGLGLGLSMVRAIITAHNGNVNVESIVGEGSTFTINLPLTKK
ncbi:HAMP domain-containing histidine kinase [Thiospirochaeta perfilievii]|uniref:histidine kinase n=1 Tax=Thiospirochaeta perfilievii TaxID=252967 RepID=A0A5C1QEV0_9SPIO|nr:HAMP domain-containing sensor histidine kinase [Thiospirochaeta perfilievii]QEN05539.1 HAMP domain-containing histidine kinase [Thiospirochaeta perfilievii]